MKNLKRGSVLGGIILGLVLMSSLEVRAQESGGRDGRRIGTTTLSFDYDGGGLSALRTYVASLIAQIEETKLKVAQLEAALNNEISERQTADTALQNAINGSSGGVSQETLAAAIAVETNARSTADAALEGQIANEEAAREELATTVASFSSLTPLVPLATYLSVDTGIINGLAGPHVIFRGVNVHVQSGDASQDSLTANGRGNLIVGYNELPFAADAERGGSHNVVVGASHRYNFGTGFVFGYASRLGGMAASVSGGGFNEAGADFSSVSGGSSNWATGQYSHVSGGNTNTASGNTATVSAGQMNTASGTTSAVSGGFNNSATATSATVGGGASTTNATPNSFVP